MSGSSTSSTRTYRAECGIHRRLATFALTQRVLAAPPASRIAGHVATVFKNAVRQIHRRARSNVKTRSFLLNIATMAAAAIGCSSGRTTHLSRLVEIAGKESGETRRLAELLQKTAPGLSPSSGVLTEKRNHSKRTELRYWEGHSDEFVVRAYQSMNEDQLHCPPVGAISAVEIETGKRQPNDRERWTAMVRRLLGCESNSSTTGCLSLGDPALYGRVIEKGSTLRIQIGCAAASDIPFASLSWEKAQLLLDDLFGPQ